MPNDDLVLNQARQQKVVAALSTPATPATTTTTTTPNLIKPVVVPKHPKSFSTGNIDQTGLEVVQIEFNFDGN
jgi:hypothetical protein